MGQFEIPPTLTMLAASIVHETTIEPQPEEAIPEKNPAAVALGRLGGLKDGKARATEPVKL